jgi:uncharacterized membrane protein/nitrite reductase/ring-hydroxylating ferredoxin subunit
MKSKAHIKGHPIHPILVGFPIAFFLGTFVFDILYLIGGNANFATTAFYLGIVGVVFALLAAAAGLVDYLYTVPPESSAKKRATKHGIINVVVVVLFLVAWFCRQNDDANFTLIVVLEAIGSVLLFISGWMGGTLVYRNQIGVNPRYAEAGKWKEAYFDQDKGRLEVATADELKTNQMKLLHCNGKRIVLAKTEDAYVAFEDRCTHKGGSLAGGSMMCGTVQCPWHGSQFDVHSGVVKAGPAAAPIAVFDVVKEGNNIYLQL